MRYLILFLSLFVYSFGAVASPHDPFSVRVQTSSPSEINVVFDVPSGYHLYKDKLSFALAPGKIVGSDIPNGEKVDDPFLGPQYVFHNSFSTQIRISSPSENPLLKVSYQGCKGTTLCLPPQTKEITLSLSDTQAQSLHSQNSLIAFFVMGILLCLTPCVLPMLPVVSSILLGNRLLSKTKSTLLVSTFSLTNALSYSILGLIAAALGHSLHGWLNHPIFLSIGAALLAMLALSMLDIIRLPMYFTPSSKAQNQGSLLNAAGLGVLSAIMLTPCITPPLFGLLAYISSTGDLSYGASRLFALGLGMNTPLAVFVLLGHRWLPKTGPWMLQIKYFFAVLLFALALSLLGRIWGPMFSIVTISLLGAGYFIYLLSRRSWRAKVMAIGLIIVSFALVSSQEYFLKTETPPYYDLHVTSPEALSTALKDTSHPVTLLDIYADWCNTCLVMEKSLFQDPTVLDALENVQVIKVDVTKDTPETRKLLSTLKVFAPPMLILLKENAEDAEYLPGLTTPEVLLNAIAPPP